MEDNAKLIESLLERATEYGKTSFEILKLKALDKTSDIASTFLPHAVVIVFLAVFMLFLNLGLALWLGEILGRTFLGFLVVAGFYLITGVIVHFFLHEWLKKKVSDFIISQVSK
ncbi:MAG: hypothetical protein WAL29_13240 [Bacteroidales bacterium]